MKPDAPANKVPRRPAWIEVNLDQLRNNFRLIVAHKPDALRFAAVVKDEAYGHGATAVAQLAVEAGATMLACANLQEAVSLRDRGLQAPILVFGERTEEELDWCVELCLSCAVSQVHTVESLARKAAAREVRAAVHVKIDTGMSRYGIPWMDSMPLLRKINALASLRLEGVFSHFAMSDEADKSFALDQLERFQEVLGTMNIVGIKATYRHICNSGGFLDLPQAHLDMVRLGIAPLGVYPSAVCRRLPGLAPAMTVKTRIAAIRRIQPGDSVGYGMRYKANSPRRIAVLPMGYADGYPRMRNQGYVLIHGCQAPVIGGVAMDATIVDVTEIPEAQTWDEVVVMGCQGTQEISVHDIAKWKSTVSYDVMTGWRSRLERVYRGKPIAPPRHKRP